MPPSVYIFGPLSVLKQHTVHYMTSKTKSRSAHALFPIFPAFPLINRYEKGVLTALKYIATSICLTSSRSYGTAIRLPVLQCIPCWLHWCPYIHSHFQESHSALPGNASLVSCGPGPQLLPGVTLLYLVASLANSE